jgi:hypothetical protein
MFVTMFPWRIPPSTCLSLQTMFPFKFSNLLLEFQMTGNVTLYSIVIIVKNNKYLRSDSGYQHLSSTAI